MVDDYCEHCGATLAPNAKFCSECGEAVSDADEWGAASRNTDADNWGGCYETTREKDTTLAAVAHVLGLVTWVIGPLSVFIVTDDEFVEENARNALNWQITFTIYSLIAFLLAFALIGIAFLLIGIPFLLILPLLNLAVCVVATIKANDGEAWKYPVTPDLI